MLLFFDIYLVRLKFLFLQCLKTIHKVVFEECEGEKVIL